MGKTQNCHATNSLPKVKQFCEGKTSCKVQSTNTHFGDPCGGTHKYLTVYYTCTGGGGSTGGGKGVPKGAKLIGGNGNIKKGTKLKSMDIPLDYEIGLDITPNNKIASGWGSIV